MTDDVEITLPPGPRCRSCGHMPCPFCIDWCDVWSCIESDDGCDGRCDFPPAELAAWVQQIEPLIGEAEEPDGGGSVYTEDDSYAPCAATDCDERGSIGHVSSRLHYCPEHHGGTP